jgi:hypothetical protein
MSLAFSSRFLRFLGPFRSRFARPRDASKVDMSGDHLKAGQLGTLDVTASTVANIGPGIDFCFAFGVIAVTAGVAAPLTIIAGGVGVVLLAFIVATHRGGALGGKLHHLPGDLARSEGLR